MSSEALPRSPTPARDTRPAPAPGSAPRRILIVEDHADTANVLRRLLAARGHNVVVAGSCADARALCAGDGGSVRDRFDVIFCDIGLPDGRGTDLVRCFRSCCSSARRIALTAHGMTDDVHDILAAGFHAHVLKPVSVENLLPHLT